MKNRPLPLSTAFMDSRATTLLRMRGKTEALLTYLAAMTLIRRRGCYARITDEFVGEIVHMIARGSDAVRDDFADLVAAGLFDAEIYVRRRVLTSRQLQLGYLRRRDAQPIPEPFRVPSAAERRRSAEAGSESKADADGTAPATPEERRIAELTALSPGEEGTLRSHARELDRRRREDSLHLRRRIRDGTSAGF